MRSCRIRWPISIGTSVRLSASNPSDPIALAVSALAGGMLHLTLDTSTATAAKVQGLLDGVASNSSSSGDDDSVRALLAHARLLLDLLPATDRTLKSLRAVREDQDQQAVRLLGIAAPEAIANDGADNSVSSSTWLPCC